jgi:hypothetical protein
MGARCVENAVVRTDSDGYTYILGEMYNDTDVYGTDIVLRATLYDAAGGVIAAQNVSYTCPGDLSPQSHLGFGVRFDQPHLPPHASFDVRPISGTASAQPPPPLNLEIVSYSAEFAAEAGKVSVSLTVRNNSSHTVVPAICAGMYDDTGKVRSISTVDLLTKYPDLTLAPGARTTIDYTLWGQDGATQARSWIWYPDASGKSLFQPTLTRIVPIDP